MTGGRRFEDDPTHRLEVGERLELVRQALGFDSMAAFARHMNEIEPGLNLDRSKLNHWEKGRHYPHPLFLRALWKHFRVSADWVLHGDAGGLPSRVADSLRAVVAASGKGGTGSDRRGREKP